MQKMLPNLAIYIHWPFCKSKCPYCDFNSHVRDKIDANSWQEAYLKEIDYFKPNIQGRTISSIFFGGGTPSLMEALLVARIIEKLSLIGRFDKNIEITLEANPTSIEAKKFKDFREAGVNRISVGIQSLDPDALKFLGRNHSVPQSIKAIETARDIFANYSFDLIYARPDQSLKEWENELSQALKLADKHISLYQLTIEKGTAFYSDYKNKKFLMPNEVLSASLYELTNDITSSVGLESYEISNYAKPGFESKHNLSYWNYDNYLGIGPGAHSRIDKQAIMMIHNPENWLDKISKESNGIQSRIDLSEREVFEEFVLMGLRTKYGINKMNFKKLMGQSLDNYIAPARIVTLKKEDLLSENETSVSATKKGSQVLNKVIEYLTL